MSEPPDMERIYRKWDPLLRDLAKGPGSPAPEPENHIDALEWRAFVPTGYDPEIVEVFSDERRQVNLHKVRSAVRAAFEAGAARQQERIAALEAQLAEAKALLNQVQIYPTRDTHPVLGDIHFYRSAAVPPDFGNRRDALAKAEGREVQS